MSGPQMRTVNINPAFLAVTPRKPTQQMIMNMFYAFTHTQGDELVRLAAAYSAAVETAEQRGPNYSEHT